MQRIDLQRKYSHLAAGRVDFQVPVFAIGKEAGGERDFAVVAVDFQRGAVYQQLEMNTVMGWFQRRGAAEGGEGLLPNFIFDRGPARPDAHCGCLSRVYLRADVEQLAGEGGEGVLARPQGKVV